MSQGYKCQGPRRPVPDVDLSPPWPTRDYNFGPWTTVRLALLGTTLRAPGCWTPHVYRLSPTDGWPDRAFQRSHGAVPPLLCQLPTGRLELLATTRSILCQQPSLRG